MEARVIWRQQARYSEAEDTRLGLIMPAGAANTHRKLSEEADERAVWAPSGVNTVELPSPWLQLTRLALLALTLFIS